MAMTGLRVRTPGSPFPAMWPLLANHRVRVYGFGFKEPTIGLGFKSVATGELKVLRQYRPSEAGA